MEGRTVSRFRILNRLGSGGMGVVYRAEDTLLGRHVALKFLPKEVARSVEAKQRFMVEARAASALQHRGICTIHDIGETDEGDLYICMELYLGETLRQRLSRGPLPVPDAMRIAAQIAGAMAKAHSGGMVHRDIKPENVIFTDDDDAVILDFGLAKLASESGLTRPDASVGTVGYMAPEQAGGHAVDQRADLFSLGVMLYEMVAGVHPFAAGHPVAVLYRVMNEEHEPLSAVRPDISPALGELVDRLLRKDPTRREASAAGVSAALGALMAAPASSAPHPPIAGARRGSATIESLAVLPFLNQSEDPEVDYLSDGITDSLIDTLSRLHRLRVMARSTVFQYGSRAVNPVDVGRELGVRAVLTGRLSLRGDMLLIRAELVDATDGTSLWGERYRRPVADLMAIEEEISRQISRSLLVRLDPDEESRLSGRGAVDPGAYQAYLKGRRVWNQWKTPDGMRSAIGFFEQALRLDPLFAPAFAGLADSYSILGNIKAIPPQEAFPKAKGYARQGLAISDEVGELHSSLAFIQRHWDWDWNAADASYRRAIELNPGYATAYRFYGGLLTGLGRHEDGIERARKALDLDPLSLIIRTALGDAYFYARRYDESIAMYEDSIRMDEGFLAGHSDLARSLEITGRYDDAIREYRTAAALAAKVPPEPSSGLANVYARMGRRDDAVRILDELIAMRGRSYVSPYGIASIYASLREVDSAFEWLDRAYEEHDQTMVLVKVHPRLDPLRTDARWSEILERMRL